MQRPQLLRFRDTVAGRPHLRLGSSDSGRGGSAALQLQREVIAKETALRQRQRAQHLCCIAGVRPRPLLANLVHGSGGG